MLHILVLEDDPVRHEAFKRNLAGQHLVITKSASNCIHLLDTYNWGYLFLDHDLGGQSLVPSGKDTGYEVAQWLNLNPEKKPERIFIHSLNPVGAANIAAVLPEAVLAPGCWTKLSVNG